MTAATATEESSVKKQKHKVVRKLLRPSSSYVNRTSNSRKNWSVKLSTRLGLVGLSRTIANSTTWRKEPDKEVWIDESKIIHPKDLKKNLKLVVDADGKDLVRYTHKPTIARPSASTPACSVNQQLDEITTLLS